MPSPVPTQGSLSDISTCEVLASLCRQEATGVLTFKAAGAEKSIYLQKGRVVFAASRDPDDRLGELLLTRGVITHEQMEQASSQVRSGKRLGTVLVESGLLPASDLPRWVREQVKEIVFSLFPWAEGEYRFLQGPLPSGEVITLKISNAEIFLAGLRRVQKWSVLRKGAGEIQVPYRLSANFRQLLNDVDLEEEDESLLQLLESGSTTMEQAARSSKLTTLVVYQIFFALRILGVLVPDALVPKVEEKRPPLAPSRPPLPKPEIQQGAARVEPVPEGPSPASRPAPSPRPASGKEAAPESVKIEPSHESAPPSPGPAGGSNAGAQTVLLKIAPVPAPPAPEPARGSPPPSPSSRKREYKVVRVEGEKLDGNGTAQIEELLSSWSRKGYSLAGVVPGKASGLFGSTPPSFFILVRD